MILKTAVAAFRLQRTTTGMLLVSALFSLLITSKQVERVVDYSSWVHDLASGRKEKKIVALNDNSNYFRCVGTFWALPANRAVNNLFVIVALHPLPPVGARFNEFTCS